VRKSKGKLGVGGGGDKECVPHVADGKAEFIVRYGYLGGTVKRSLAVR
jgi:hypothetical protein